MANQLIKLPHNGKTYEIFDTDVTVARLMQYRGWYGKEYGAYAPFIGMLMEFDAAALICALWTAKTKAGEPCDPKTLDFSPADVIEANKPRDEVADDDDDAESELGPTTPVATATSD